MKKNKKLLLGLLVILFGVITSCNIMAEEIPPYYIEGYLECKEDSELYDNAGLTFRFYNISDKNIASFTVVFFLYDENGELVSDDSDAFVFTVEFPMKKREYIPLTVALDGFLSEKVNDKYFIENLYISKIVYDDGTDWGDPLGIYCPEIMYGESQ